MNPFSRIFGKPKPTPTTRIEITGRPAAFSAFSGDLYANDIYRAGVDSIARVFAKSSLQPVCEFSDGSRSNVDERLARLLQIEPNPLMTGYDLLYLMVTHLYTYNNAYCYLQRKGGQIVAIWPLHVTNCELVQGVGGKTMCAMTFANGRTSVLDYGDVVHLKRHQKSGDYQGDTNNAIGPAVSLADAQNKAIEDAIRSTTRVRGLIKYASSIGETQKQAYKTFFEETQLKNNATGIILVPPEIDFTPISDTTPTINPADVEQVKKKIYGYLGISEAIVDSSFTDDNFASFQESVIEALTLQCTLEFTRKCYTPAQIARGRRIVCTTGGVSFIGIKNRAELIRYAAPTGAFKVNEIRDLMGLEPVEDGDVRMQSLNYQKANGANDAEV